VALLAYSEEWQTILSFPKRVVDQINFVSDQFQRAGLRPRIVDEQGVVIDQKGQLRFAEDGERVDLLMFITVCVSFMDKPELLKAVVRYRISHERASEMFGYLSR
jgi:hypothetical protein